MRFPKTSFIFAIAAAVSLASINVEARVGGSARPASVSHAPAAAAPKPSAAPAQASRAGQGTSTGMQRNNVMAEARAQSPAKAPQTAPGTPAGNNGGAVVGSGGGGSNNGSNGNYGSNGAGFANNGTGVQPRQGYSGTQVLGAAAAGAVGGYMLNGVMHPGPSTTVVNNGAPGYGGQQGVPGAVVDGAPNGYTQPGNNGNMQSTGGFTAPPGGSSGLGGFGWFIVLLMLSGLGFYLWRRYSGTALSVSSPLSFNTAATPRSFSMSPDSKVEAELLSMATQTFRGLQTANNSGDKAALADLVDVSYLSTLTDDIDTREGVSDTQVHAVKIVGNRVLGFERQDSRYVGSIHFHADLSEGNAPSSDVEEVWHFVHPLTDGGWKLAGIQQV